MRKSWPRVLLSLWLGFHLFGVVMAPNAANQSKHKPPGPVQFYLSVLGLGSTWNYFAPEPVNPPLFIEWEVLSEKEEVISKESFPDRNPPFWLRERQSRRLAAARVLVMDDGLTERFFLPYLCNTYNGAHAVRIWRVGYAPLKLEDAQAGRRPASEDRVDRRWVSHSFCAGGAK